MKERAFPVNPKKERERSARDVLGKYLYNLSQTCFTAMVVGGIVAYFTSNVDNLMLVALLLIGLISTLLLAYIANYILNKY